MIYAILMTAVAAAHIAIIVFLAGNAEDYPGYNAFSMSLIVLIWVQFCLMSRRFHDSSNGAMFLVPLMVATVAAYLFAIDSSPLANSPFQEDRDEAALYDHVRMVFQAIGFVLIIFALRAPGNDGLNAYGPEFVLGSGEPKARNTVTAKPPQPIAKPISKQLRTAQAESQPRPLDSRGIAYDLT